MHKIAQKRWSEWIFRAYDIRGKYPEEINEDAAYKIARAFARYLKIGNTDGRVLKIVISADARVSSPALKEMFIEGLSDEDVEIIDAGLTTTPMHYFIVNKTNADGGAMITASHIPPPANGIKLSKRGAVPIYGGGGMEELKNDAVRGIFSAKGAGGQVSGGAVYKKDFLNDYIQFLTSYFSPLTSHSVSLVVCAGNGMTSILLRKLFSKFPKIKVKFLHDDLDMTFPNHEADPIKPGNIVDVQEEVKNRHYDLGISFDGDGDRVGFLDKRGRRVGGDIVTALLAKYFAKRQQGLQAIIYDLRSSRVVREEIEKYGMRPVESRVGHAFIKAIMRKENAVFGGELSGHYYFKDFFYAESALFAALALLDLMRLENKSLDELAKPLLKYAKSEEINFTVKDREKTLDKIAAHFSDPPDGGQEAKISYLDGIKIEYPDWWFNLRPAANENLLRLNLEAATPKLLEQKKKLIEELLGKDAARSS